MSICPKGTSVTKVLGQKYPITPATPYPQANITGNGFITKCSSPSSSVVTTTTPPPGTVPIPPPVTTINNTTQVPTQGLGFYYEGEWAVGNTYVEQEVGVHVNGSVVTHNGKSYVATTTHVADTGNEPGIGTNWDIVWDIWGGGTSTSTSTSSGGIVDDLFDWVSDIGNWGLGDWLQAIAGVASVVMAGTALVDVMSSDGEDQGTGAADGVQYTGTWGYSGSYTAPTLAQVLSDLCLRSGMTTSEFNVSGVQNTTVEGLLTSRPSASSIIELLVRTYQLTWTTSGGVIKFGQRSVSPVVSIPDSDWAFGTDETNISSKFQTKRAQASELPRKVMVEYTSRDMNYNPFSQESPELESFPEGQEVSIAVPFTLTPNQARKAADDILIQPHLERTTWSGTTSYKYAFLEPGDIVTSSKGSGRIIELRENTEGLIEFIFSDAGLSNQPVPVYSGATIIGYTASDYVGSNVPPTPEPVQYNAPKTFKHSGVIVIDVPALYKNDYSPRVFLAVHGFGDTNWPGAAVYLSKDAGSSYKFIDATKYSANFGYVAAITQTPILSGLVWDKINSISVEMKQGTLTSCTEIECLNYSKNMALIGSEVISFKTATLTGTGPHGGNLYTLTNLIRGRKGTEWVYEETYGSHIAQELFVLIDSNLIKYDMQPADRGIPFKWKAVTQGSDISVAKAWDFTAISSNTIPFRVSQVKSTTANNNHTLTWVERNRWNDDDLVDYVETSRDDDWAGWAISIMTDDLITEKRKVNVTSPTFTYTSAMQIEDFGAVKPTVKFRIATISRLYGTGYVKNFTN